MRGRYGGIGNRILTGSGDICFIVGKVIIIIRISITHAVRLRGDLMRDGIIDNAARRRGGQFRRLVQQVISTGCIIAIAPLIVRRAVCQIWVWHTDGADLIIAIGIIGDHPSAVGKDRRIGSRAQLTIAAIGTGDQHCSTSAAIRYGRE